MSIEIVLIPISEIRVVSFLAVLLRIATVSD